MLRFAVRGTYDGRHRRGEASYVTRKPELYFTVSGEPALPALRNCAYLSFSVFPFAFFYIIIQRTAPRTRPRDSSCVREMDAKVKDADVEDVTRKEDFPFPSR